MQSSIAKDLGLIHVKDGSPALQRAADIASYAVKLMPNLNRMQAITDPRMSLNAQVLHAANEEPYDKASQAYDLCTIKMDNNTTVKANIPAGDIDAHSTYPGTPLFADPMDGQRGYANDPNLPHVATLTVRGNGNNASIPELMGMRFIGVSRVKFDAKRQKESDAAVHESSVMIHGVTTQVNTSSNPIHAGDAVGFTLAGPVTKSEHGVLIPANQFVGDSKESMRPHMFSIDRTDWADECHGFIAEKKAEIQRTDDDHGYDFKKTEELYNEMSVFKESGGTASFAHSAQNMATFLKAVNYLANHHYTARGTAHAFVAEHKLTGMTSHEIAQSASTCWLALVFTNHRAMFYRPGGKPRTYEDLAEDMHQALADGMDHGTKRYKQVLQLGWTKWFSFILQMGAECEQTQKALIAGIATEDIKPGEKGDVFIGV